MENMLLDTPPSAIAASKAQEILGRCGRMVGGSKTIYRHENPNNLVIFNANIATQADGKIWYGDIDVTNDLEKLNALAKALGKRVYVLYESAGRFDMEAIIDNDFDEYCSNSAERYTRQIAEVRAGATEGVLSEEDKAHLVEFHNEERDYINQTPTIRGVFDRLRAEAFEKAIFCTDGETPECRDEDYRMVEGKIIHSPDYTPWGISQRLLFDDIDMFDTGGPRKRKGKRGRAAVESPLHALCRFVCKQLGIRLKKDEVINTSEIVMTKDDHDILMYLCRRWMKANTNIHPARLDSECGWLTFAAPSINHHDDLYLESGYLYIKDRSKLVVKRGKD